MRLKLRLRGKTGGFAGENEKEFDFKGKTIRDLLEEISVEYGVGARHWQWGILVNGKRVQDLRAHLTPGDTVTLTLHPILGGG